MAEETSSTTSQNGNWFANFDWRTNAILILLSSVFGFSGGSIAPKGAAQGINQEAADVRYLTKEKADVNYLSIESADKRSEKRDKQSERLEQKIDSFEVKRQEDQKETRTLLMEIIQNQKAPK